MRRDAASRYVAFLVLARGIFEAENVCVDGVCRRPRPRSGLHRRSCIASAQCSGRVMCQRNMSSWPKHGCCSEVSHRRHTASRSEMASQLAAATMLRRLRFQGRARTRHSSTRALAEAYVATTTRGRLHPRTAWLVAATDGQLWEGHAWTSMREHARTATRGVDNVPRVARTASCCIAGAGGERRLRR